MIEHGVDPTAIKGTGKDGRLTKADVMAFLKEDDSNNVTPGEGAAERVATEGTVGPERSEKRVPMSRLRARIAERPFVVSSQLSVPITASVGLASMGFIDDTPERIFKRADNALYAAKRDGRNRVVSDAAA